MQKKNIVLLCLITFLQGMVFYAAVATLYRQAAGLSVFAITAIEGISVGLSLLLEVPWGRIADRIGYRRTLIVCNALFVVTKIIFWKADGFAGFLAERLLLAAVISGISGVDAAMLYLSAPPEDAQRHEGWYAAAGEAGVLLSGLLYTFLLSGRYRDAAGWTVFSYSLAALLTFFLTEVRPASRRRPDRSLFALAAEHFRVPGMAALVLCGALFLETGHCVTVYFSQLKYLSCGLNDRMIGLAFVAVSSAGLLSPLSDRLTRRLGIPAAGCGLLLLSAVGMGALSRTGSGLLSVLLIVLIAAASALFRPLAGALENRLIAVPDRATALSMNAMIGDGLIVLLDMGLGRAAEHSLNFGFGLCGLCCLTAAGAFALFCRQTGQRGAAGKS